jgi:phosphohistidine phosphatase
MNLCLIRHAEAQPRSEGVEDELRALTDKGWDQCRLLAEALQRVGLRPGVFVVSPLVRARQTAEGMLRHWPEPRPEVRECVHLAPGGKARKLVRFLRGLEGDTIAAIGHEPDLSRFTGWLIGTRKVEIQLDKAGAALVTCEAGPGKGLGVLTWLVNQAWCVAGADCPAQAG